MPERVPSSEGLGLIFFDFFVRSVVKGAWNPLLAGFVLEAPGGLLLGEIAANRLVVARGRDVDADKLRVCAFNPGSHGLESFEAGLLLLPGQFVAEADSQRAIATPSDHFTDLGLEVG